MIDKYQNVPFQGVLYVLKEYLFLDNTDFSLGPHGTIDDVKSSANTPFAVDSAIFFRYLGKPGIQFFNGVPSQDTHLPGQGVTVEGDNIVVEEDRFIDGSRIYGFGFRFRDHPIGPDSVLIPGSIYGFSEVQGREDGDEGAPPLSGGI
jgi:hypothetical protein